MMNKGLWYALGAYIAWGLFPIYWKWLHQVDAVQLIGHRIGWSFIMLMIFIFASGQVQALRLAAYSRRVLLIYMFAAVLIGINWLVYVWAVNANFIVETSLGYFINPILSVLMGVIFLRERLRTFQWFSVILAMCGVIYLTIAYGRLPWIALTLAFSFGTYGLVKKISPLGSLFGLTIETGILFIPALIYLIYADISGSGVFLRGSGMTNFLLVGAGLITTIPLLMFASAAQSIPLSMVGIMQYIAPTIQFLLGVLVYKEPFDKTHLIGFSIVWIALAFYIMEGFWTRQRTPHPFEPIPEMGEG
ncbi:MAG: EamA family transporter RarD [Chloroflexi bacterium]|nr:EamA family transporter RarD [Chloroflexota bacterium]